MSAVFAACGDHEPSGLRTVLQRSLGESRAAGIVTKRRLDIHRKDTAACHREQRLELVGARSDQLHEIPDAARPAIMIEALLNAHRR